MTSKELDLFKNFFQSLSDLSADMVDRLEKLSAQPEPARAEVKTVVAAPAPAPVQQEQPIVEEAVAAHIGDELSEVPRPSAHDLQDPTYPRARLEAFLQSRGFMEDQFKTLLRTDLVKKCRDAIEAMNAVQPGVKRGRGRPRKDGLPNKSAVQAVEARDPAADIAVQLQSLDPETRSVMGKLLNISVDSSTFAADVASAVSNDLQALGPVIEAARAVLIQPLIADEADQIIEAAQEQIAAEAQEEVDSSEDDDEVVVEPTPAPIPVEVVVQKSMPAPQRVANTDLSAVPQGGVVNQVVTAAANKFGYKGKLLGYIANVELRNAGELLSTQLQKAAGGEFGEAPAEMVSSYLRSMAPVGEDSCGGSCLKCPRGGGQLAICATLLDREVMHGGLELVRDGKIRILMQPTGAGLSDSAAGYAKFEDVFEFGG